MVIDADMDSEIRIYIMVKKFHTGESDHIFHLMLGNAVSELKLSQVSLLQMFS